ncbi:MAG: fasciclin domain-containing protein [Actinomycetia bacterium]|nr:fasciclin domain-containing protein [Actinomycetes bacterium]
MKKFIGVLTASLMVALLGTSAVASAQEEEPTQNIVEIASGNEDFSTLVTAVSEAGLVDTLSGEGPFTVFAPTNEAFAALPEGTLETLLADPSGALTDILTLHVVSGAVDSAAAIAAAGGNVETLGGPVAVELRGDDLYVGGAKVVTTDIKATNGIIHVIDAVITEPATPEVINAGGTGVPTNPASPVVLAMLVGLGLFGLAISGRSLARARNQG